MKKVIKKTASSRKPVEPPRGFIKPSMAKKPMMKSGGAKKSLPKAKFGKRKGNPVSSNPFGPKSGPLTEDQSKYVDYRLDKSGMPKKDFTSRDATVRLNPYTSEPEMPLYRSDVQEMYERGQREGKTFNTSSKPSLYSGDQMITTFKSQKKGGATKALPKAGPGKIIKALGTGIKKAGKVVKNELTPDRGGYNPFKKKTPIKSAAKIGTLGAGYVLGAKAILDRDKKKAELLEKKKTAKPSKPKQLGPQSFAKGGATKMAMKKTMVKFKKK